MRADSLVLTCEHATARIPPDLRRAFREARRALVSHRGLDLGALALARHLAAGFDAPLVTADVSRLVVDLNRSLHHPRLFSEWTRRLDGDERELLVERYWRPFRARVKRTVESALAVRAPVVHVSVHSFTPRLRGVTRKIDVALLYDPARKKEREFAACWIDLLRGSVPRLRLRRNAPYRGTSDGLTTWLRTLFDAEEYVGLELEVSQRFPRGDPGPWRELQTALADTLGRSLRARSASGAPQGHAGAQRGGRGQSTGVRST